MEMVGEVVRRVVGDVGWQGCQMGGRGGWLARDNEKITSTNVL